MKNILVTGATGFIGSYLLEELIHQNYNIIALKRSSTDTWRIDEFLDKIKTYDIDVDGLEKAFEENQIDCVIHLAANYIKFTETIADLDQMVGFNLNISSQICDLAVKNGVKYWINSGTMFEYALKDEKIKETDKKLAYNFFSATKLAFNEVLRFYADKHDFKVVDLKLFAPIGERDNPKVMQFLIKSLLENNEVDFSGGEQKWNFTYVRDLVSAYLASLDYLQSADFDYESFNIGCDEVYSLRDCVRILEEVSDKKLNINFGAKPYIDNEIFYVNCDNTKAKQLLKWHPKHNLASALKIMYAYYCNHSR